MQPKDRETANTIQPAHAGVSLLKNTEKTKSDEIAMNTIVPIKQIVGLKRGLPERPTTAPNKMRIAPHMKEYSFNHLTSGLVEKT